MGVNNIRHYNYSHTATPIHPQLPPAFFQAPFQSPYASLCSHSCSVTLSSHFFLLVQTRLIVFPHAWSNFCKRFSGFHMRRVVGADRGKKVNENRRLNCKTSKVGHEHSWWWRFCVSSSRIVWMRGNSQGKYFNLGKFRAREIRFLALLAVFLLQQRPLNDADCVVNHVICY